ncbi:hypothetical protein [Burkholderia gladioli]|uniref:hypothetical protein n=1 Tax=Burkholderia gladioli TaxID=28095 RepID=UPI0016403C8D|nr:hypothetical protein [Burkholderia gladioli]MBU9320655.1 hypothetical protein [Burkholderia gladioli]MDN7462724.1 hypothetical protein [Burkholderia gladioli]
MVRAVDDDFEVLKRYLADYQLGGFLNDAGKLSVVKSAHKTYLPFLQLWAICKDAFDKGNFWLFGHHIPKSNEQFPYLKEVVSDVGSGFFCCLHGAYKPGHMALRSSIENFLRFSAGVFDPEAMKTTSVYELFSIAKKAEPFSGERNVHLSSLRASYVELCQFTHSASLDHMAGIHALAHFPSFDEAAFKHWVALARTCIVRILSIILLGQPSLYRNAHFSAKELLDELLPHTERLILLKGMV